MSNNVTEYENLKKEIVHKSRDTLDLQKVKEYFSCVIESQRSLIKVKNLNDVFILLEKRDALDYNNVSALVHLGNLLGNEDITNLVRGYKKLFIEDEGVVCTCGQDLSFTPSVPLPQIKNPVENKQLSLKTAMNNIAMNIGIKWRVLARELIKECYIDEISEKYPGDLCKQAQKSLEIWEKCNGNAATLDILIRALEARQCKRKGIGVHLLQPVILVD